jgi:hypothetical protein
MISREACVELALFPVVTPWRMFGVLVNDALELVETLRRR